MAADAPEQTVTRAELTEALSHANHTAKRAPHIVEKRTTDAPTAWSKAHKVVDDMLTDWQDAPA